MYQVREANQMVEEFMLAANMSVAAKILEHFPSCSLLRYVATSSSSDIDYNYSGTSLIFSVVSMHFIKLLKSLMLH